MKSIIDFKDKKSIFKEVNNFLIKIRPSKKKKNSKRQMILLKSVIANTMLVLLISAF